MFRPRKTNKELHLSREHVEKLTDQQLIEQAKARSAKPILTVNDLFALYGAWSPFYVRAMFLNGILFSIGLLHSQLLRLSFSTMGDYVFWDCNETEYTLLNSNKSGMNETIAEERMIDQMIKVDVASTLSRLGFMLGYLIMIWLRRMSSRKMVFIASTLYFFGSYLMFFNYVPLIKVAYILTGCTAAIIELSALLNMMDCLPVQLRPLSMFIVNSMELITSSLLMICLRMTDDWKIISLVVGPVVFLSGCIYYSSAPLNLLRVLAHGNSEKLKREVEREFYSKNASCGSRPTAAMKEKKKARKHEMLDADSLIDDVVFRGHIYVNEFEKLSHILSVNAFTYKYLALILYAPISSILEEMAYVVGRKFTYLTVFDAELLYDFTLFIGYFTAFIFVGSLGRRLALFSGGIIGIVGLTVSFLIPLQIFNICTRIEQPNNSWMGHATQTIILFGSSLSQLVTPLMLCEHVPCSCRDVLIPVAYLIRTTVTTMVEQVDKSFLEAYVSSLPNMEMIVSLCYIMIVLPVIYFIDDSDFMPITQTDIPCYYRQRKKYKTPQAYDDGTNYKIVGTSSETHNKGATTTTTQEDY